MADVRLYRTDDKRIAVAAVFAKHISQRLYFYRIAERCSGAMSFHVTYVRGLQARAVEGLPHHRLLRWAVRRR